MLVLDEPTAHLEAATARSVLLITHRPRGLDLVDEIVTLRAGRVVERRGPPLPVA